MSASRFGVLARNSASGLKPSMLMIRTRSTVGLAAGFTGAMVAGTGAGIVAVGSGVAVGDGVLVGVASYRNTCVAVAVGLGVRVGIGMSSREAAAS